MEQSTTTPTATASTVANDVRSLMNASHDAIIVMDTEGRVADWNRAATRMFGWRPSEIRGQLVSDLIVPPELREAHSAGWRGRLASPSSDTVGPYELPALRRDGERFVVEISISLLGSGRMFVAFIRDVTEQVNERRRQAELRRAQELTELVMNSTGLLVATIGVDGTFLQVNDRVCETVGYSRRELLKMTVADVVAPNDLEHVGGAFNMSAGGGTVSRFDASIIRRDGETRQVSFGLTPVIEDGELVAFVGAAEDVTDQKRTQEALANTEKLQSLAALAGGVAHDFNNLLTTILGNVAVLRTLPEGDPQRTEALADIELAGRHAADLARQMLAYAGKSGTQVESLDLDSLLAGIEPLLRAILPRNITVAREQAASHCQVLADVTQLRQVILNIVHNAAEAIGQAPGTVTVTTGVRRLDLAALARCVGGGASLEGDYAFIRVSDDGPGMPSEVRSKVFDPFFSTRFAGRGLGLSAVFGIVRAHHGVIDVESAPGEGATFTVYLPAHRR